MVLREYCETIIFKLQEFIGNHMGQISVSDHLHEQLKELKDAEEHKSLDSVIRVLLERSKRVSTDDHLTALDDSKHGTIEVTARIKRDGPKIDPLLPPEEPTREEALEYLDRVCIGSTTNHTETFNKVPDDTPIREKMLSVAQNSINFFEVRPHLSREEVAERLQKLFPDTEMDEEMVLDHIDALTDSALEISPSHAQKILQEYYQTEGVPSQSERTLEVDLDEVVSLVEEVSQSETPRKTARELLTADSQNDYSWETIWFLAPLSPDVEIPPRAKYIQNASIVR
jgi:predicted CopG family antitoxin